MFPRPSRHLLNQTCSWNEHIPHVAIQSLSKFGESSQRNTAFSFGYFELSHALGADSNAAPQRVGTHSESEPDGFDPSTPGCTISVEPRVFTELRIQLCQAGYVQATFQGINGGLEREQQLGCARSVRAQPTAFLRPGCKQLAHCHMESSAIFARKVSWGTT